MEKAEILAKIKKMSDYIGDNFHIVDHSLYRNKSKEHYKSYSTISKALTWDKFQHIPKRYLDEASLRGSQIHDAIEQTFLMGLEVFPVDEKYEIYFRGFQRFWFDNEIEVIAIEERFVDEDKKTSGKIDFIGFLDGKLTVIDWKTSKILDK
jgi:ATP-dependent exoDNAse (exonuclease V) beta subunit